MSISAKNASDRLVAVFCLGTLMGRGSVINAEAERRDGAWPTVSCDDSPRRRIERYEPQREEEGRFGGVNEGSERHDCYVVVEARRANIQAIRRHKTPGSHGHGGNHHDFDR
jgi:hypothetical protein